MSFILSIDQGTTGTKVMLVDAKSCRPVDSVTKNFKQYYPSPGLVEHDLSEIWRSVESAAAELFSRHPKACKNILSIGITNQRETICPWDRKSGKPIAKALVWQDRRTADWCRENSAKFSSWGTPKTGLPLDPYFSAPKMRWLLQNSPEIASAADKNNLCFSTIESFLLFKLTNGQSFKTDASNASRTLLMDINSGSWDQELLDFFQVPRDCLPEICDSIGELGKTQGLGWVTDGTPIHCLLGDQQAALMGQACFQKGQMKCTYGTGAFALINTGEKKVEGTKGLLATVAYQYQGKIFYALEGASYIAGAAVQWIRDNLGLVENSGQSEKLAREVKNLDEMKNVLFFPYFSGIGSPHWQSSALGAIVGLTRDTDRAHLVRACLEGVALSVHDILESFFAIKSLNPTELRVDGGASLNSFLMQEQASFGKLEIKRPEVSEVTSYGAALGALVGRGEMKIQDIEQVWKEEKSFSPRPSEYHKNKKELWKSWQQKIFF